ncbi:MAG: zinc-ribbon domain containing protein [Vicinamibacterales bacterium]
MFRAADQGFYEQRGYAQPRRCPPCRRLIRPLVCEA